MIFEINNYQRCALYCLDSMWDSSISTDFWSLPIHEFPNTCCWIIVSLLFLFLISMCLPPSICTFDLTGLFLETLNNCFAGNNCLYKQPYSSIIGMCCWFNEFECHLYNYKMNPTLYKYATFMHLHQLCSSITCLMSTDVD